VVFRLDILRRLLVDEIGSPSALVSSHHRLAGGGYDSGGSLVEAAPSVTDLMTWIAYLVGALLVWTIIGLAYFVANLGRKTGRGHWYDGIILLPLYPLASLVGWLLHRKDKLP
jgi:hypothetical protein